MYPAVPGKPLVPPRIFPPAPNPFPKIETVDWAVPFVLIFVEIIFSSEETVIIPPAPLLAPEPLPVPPPPLPPPSVNKVTLFTETVVAVPFVPGPAFRPEPFPPLPGVPTVIFKVPFSNCTIPLKAAAEPPT